MRVASFDIGLFNTGVYIEDFDDKTLSKIKNIPRKSRYKPSGEPSKEYQIILDKIFLNGDCVYTGKINFSSDIKKKYIDKATLCDITNIIKNLDILSSCDFIIIEKQLDINKKAKRIENHIHSLLNILFPNIESVVYNASNKTQVLGAPKKVKNSKGQLKKMTKPERKKWACATTRYILNLRGDTVLYEYLFCQSSKPDDESDCICQLQSAKYKIFIEKSLKVSLKSGNIDNIILKNDYNVVKDYLVKCNKGHCFDIENSSGCEECKKQDIIDKLHGIISKFKAIVISLGNPVKLKCYYNHIFWLSQEDIVAGMWCMDCIKDSRQKIYDSFVKKDTDTIFYDYISITEYYSNKRNVIFDSSRTDVNYISNHIPLSRLIFFDSQYTLHPLYELIDQKLEVIKELSIKHGCFCISNTIYSPKIPLLFYCNVHKSAFEKSFKNIKLKCRSLCDCKKIKK